MSLRDSLESCRLPPSWESGIGIQKQVTTIPVRKPTASEWFRVRSGEEWTYDALIFKDTNDHNKVYLVLPEFWDELQQQNLARPARFFSLLIHGSNTLILSDVGLADREGNLNRWHESRLEHYERAKNEWVKISSNVSVGAYDLWVPKGNLPDPEWPEEPENMMEALEIAFKGQVIDSDDHPILKRLRGLA